MDIFTLKMDYIIKNKKKTDLKGKQILIVKYCKTSYNQFYT